MAMAANGDVMVVTRNEASDHTYYATRKSAGGSWEPLARIGGSSTDGGEPTVPVWATADNGFVTIWNANPDQMVAVAAPGQPFGTPVSLGPTPFAVRGALAVTVNHVMVAWTSSIDPLQSMLSFRDM
jgi:hypothetical protein